MNMARTEAARIQLRLAGCILVLASLVGGCLSTAAAQEKRQDEKGVDEHALPKGGPTPRVADGHPDLSGVWFPGYTGGYSTDHPAAQRQFDPKVTPEERPAYQPW